MTLADDDLLEAIAADYDDFHDYPPTARPHHLISVEDLGWLIRQVQHWRANHDEMVARNRLLRDRHDLPVDRTAAHNTLIRLQAEISELKAGGPAHVCASPLVGHGKLKPSEVAERVGLEVSHDEAVAWCPTHKTMRLDCSYSRG